MLRKLPLNGGVRKANEGVRTLCLIKFVEADELFLQHER